MSDKRALGPRLPSAQSIMAQARNAENIARRASYDTLASSVNNQTRDSFRRDFTPRAVTATFEPLEEVPRDRRQRGPRFNPDDLASFLAAFNLQNTQGPTFNNLDRPNTIDGNPFGGAGGGNGGSGGAGSGGGGSGGGSGGGGGGGGPTQGPRTTNCPGGWRNNRGQCVSRPRNQTNTTVVPPGGGGGGGQQGGNSAAEMAWMANMQAQGWNQDIIRTRFIAEFGHAP